MDRILLVEGDVEVRPLLEHILLDNGFQVTTAESVAIATELLVAQCFDLVVCDVNLPDASGLTLADKAIAAGIKALLLTRQGLSPKPGSLAPYDYLLKPLRVAELLAGIERCLADYGGESEVTQFPKPGT
jgi:DNA-binding NtrC family response regulator